MDTVFILFGFLIFLALALAIYVWVSRLGKKISPTAKQKVKIAWQQIMADQDAKQAILEADKLLDFALRQHGYQGVLGEKLKKARDQFTHIDGVWKAHKVRNQIAHEIGFKVSPQLHKQCLSAFKGALQDLEVL